MGDELGLLLEARSDSHWNALGTVLGDALPDAQTTLGHWARR
jgi:hypothetical protein